MFESNILTNVAPKPAEIVTLPVGMDCHEHRYPQIVIGLKGQTEFEVSGYGNRVGPGQGCVVSAEANHAFGGLTGDTDILVLNLVISAQDEPVFFQRINALSHSDIYFRLDKQMNQVIRLLSLEMKSFPDDYLLSRGCHDTLITMLYRHILGDVPCVKESRFDLGVIDAYIEKHISRRITVAQLAGSVFLGESQFHFRFKELMGMTPHQYVLHKRVEIAKLLIGQGGYSLGQVAELTGFSGQSTFTHAFCRLQGISPSAYKQNSQS